MSAVKGAVSSTSTDVTPSSKYVCWCPGTMFINSSGTLTYNSATSTSASSDTVNDWVAGFSSALWLVAGVPIKIRASTTLPGGLSATTTYYAGKPTADRLRFYTSSAAAVAGGAGYVDITSVGSGTFTVYPAYAKDWSGNGNDLLLGASQADAAAYASPPYIAGASSASVDSVALRLPFDVLAARWQWPTTSLIVAARVKIVAAVTAGRSMFGCGQTAPSQHGPRISVDSTTVTSMNLQFFHAGGVISCGTSAAAVFETGTEHHFMLAIDGPRRSATVWIDGRRDLVLNEKSLETATTVSVTADLRFGGASATNAQASMWRDVHVLVIPGEVPSTADKVAAVLSQSPLYRLQCGDI